MKPNPHCRGRFKTWRFKPEYVRDKHLGPVTHPQARKKAERTYELMQAVGLSNADLPWGKV